MATKQVALGPQFAPLAWPRSNSPWRLTEDDRTIAGQVGCREPVQEGRQARADLIYPRMTKQSEMSHNDAKLSLTEVKLGGDNPTARLNP
jgi:hypothetical protein